MPIKYSEYHPEWKTRIRPNILQRDFNRCKFCGVLNYSFGYRDRDGNFISETKFNGLNSTDGDILFDGKYPKRIKIILTIAHLDHNKTNNDYDNLAALCQKCHLGIDLKHHMGNARETRNKKKGLQKLF